MIKMKYLQCKKSIQNKVQFMGSAHLAARAEPIGNPGTPLPSLPISNPGETHFCKNAHNVNLECVQTHRGGRLYCGSCHPPTMPGPHLEAMTITS